MDKIGLTSQKTLENYNLKYTDSFYENQYNIQLKFIKTRFNGTLLRIVFRVQWFVVAFTWKPNDPMHLTFPTFCPQPYRPMVHGSFVLLFFFFYIKIICFQDNIKNGQTIYYTVDGGVEVGVVYSSRTNNV